MFGGHIWPEIIFGPDFVRGSHRLVTLIDVIEPPTDPLEAFTL